MPSLLEFRKWGWDLEWQPEEFFKTSTYTNRGGQLLLTSMTFLSAKKHR